jgi:hypothetical protein
MDNITNKEYDMEYIDSVLCEWENIYRNEITGSEKLLSSIIEEWHDVFCENEENHQKYGHNFNVFSLLRVECDFHVSEIRHSRLLKYLLSPSASHGQKDIFLNEFLKMLDIDTKGIWKVGAERDSIDILLVREDPETVIIIENKSNWAGDQPNQLYRYWYNAVYRRTKSKDENFYNEHKNRYRIIYLTPNENKIYQEQSISKPSKPSKQEYSEYSEYFGSIDEYEYDGLPEKLPVRIDHWFFNDHIQKWLDECVKRVPETNHRIKEYILQYQTLCKYL